MKKLLSITALSAIMLASTPAFSVEIGTLKIQEILQKSKAVSDVQKQTEEQSKSIQKEVQEKDKKLGEEGKELEKQRTVLEQKAYDKKVEEFNKKVSALKTDLQTRLSALKQANADAMNQIQKKMVEIVATIAKEKKLDAVAQREAMVFAADSLDITPAVLEQLDKALPSMKVTIKK